MSRSRTWPQTAWHSSPQGDGQGRALQLCSHGGPVGSKHSQRVAATPLQEMTPKGSLQVGLAPAGAGAAEASWGLPLPTLTAWPGHACRTLPWDATGQPRVPSCDLLPERGRWATPQPLGGWKGKRTTERLATRGTAHKTRRDEDRAECRAAPTTAATEPRHGHVRMSHTDPVQPDPSTA